MINFDSNVEKFFENIKGLMEDGQSSPIDAIVQYAERNELEIDVVANMAKSIPVLYSSIIEEAREMNLITETSTILPF
jgi:hypothetical protein|tara:strand:- start:7077 stop:7310 length:234 start_codon:yes stop_codon:yes gene_type:complete